MRRSTEMSQQQQQQQQQVSSTQEIRQEQRTTQQRVVRQQVQGMVVQEGMIVQGYPSGTPPVFERVFSNARFAQGGDALFEGRVTGDPKPVISWTRKGAPLMASQKHQLRYEEQTGNVSLLISRIGPGDEGEYTCTARNQLGEAMCSVYIQPEGVAMPVQPQGARRDTQMRQTQQQMTQMQQMQTMQQSQQHVQTIQQQQQMQQNMQTIQQRTQQSTHYANGFTTIEEDFKVDTFEYRLLREVSFRESLTRRGAGESDVSLTTTLERQLGPPAPPQVAAKPRNSKLQEGADAVFTANVPGNPRPRLTWFKNGKRLVFSQKHQTAYSNQQAQLRISQVNSQDSGHYTMLAENPQGCVVTSAYLAVEPSAAYEQTIERETRQMIQIEREESVEGKMIAPNFARTCSDREVSESKMTRFDCRVTGRPYPEVTWYINGRQVVDDASHKILVNESGNHALMITNVSRADSGVVTCVARNKAGETSFECKLIVIEKELVVAPKFVQRFGAASIKEGEPVSLTARAVGTPIPNITWQKDGVPINSGNGITISTSGGGSTLEIIGAKAQDAGWYQCMAQNMAGSTATRARVHVQKIVKQDLSQPSRLHLPTPTTVIQPEPAPEPEIIYLRHVERAAPRPARGEQDRVYPPPQFIIPLSDQAQVEGNRVHFEARVEPVGDPTMNIQWYHNGKVLPASSRITTTFRFGFIALDMLSIVPEDAGEYACVVATATGNAQSVAKLTVTGRVSIDQKSQYPESLQYITQLEDYSKYQRSESVEELSPVRPQFIRPLKDLGQLQEGRNAHFEAQLTPVSDPTMRVDWFKDGKPITASSRITTIFNFGYVSLNILHLRSEDSGVYTVRAVNRWGEAVSQSSVTVISRNSVTADLGIPEQQRYIESVEALEAYTQQSHMRQAYEPPESSAPPVFQSQVQDQLNIKEGGFAHFEARLEPVGDSTLRVEWYKDGRPVEASSRITSFFNFGYVALTIKHVATHDMGRYTCRAYNTLGEATTSANLSVISKQDIISDSQHTSSLQKIQHLEESSRYMRQVQEDTTVTQKPRFLGPLKGTNRIVEGQRAHFEARVEPLSDTTMKIEWYFNGRVLQTANRIQTYHDFGYVALDIESVRAEDAGTYTVIARNALGEAQLQASMQVETRSGIDTRSMHHGAYDKTKQIEQHRHVEPTYNIEEISKSRPIFVTPLSDPPPANEGKNIHLECRLEPMGDPTMRVEWFQNGKPITIGSRFRTYHDFGYVALDIVHVTSMDSGEYTVRATNHLGSAHTSACVRVMSRSDILTDTQNENSLEQIQYLEDSKMRRHVQEDVTIMSAPVFTRSLHNIESLEGTNIHLECRLQPVGDPTMRVDWFVNGKPVRVGHRFRPAYDFDYVALDLLSVYPEDSGVYTCQARNQLGEAVTSSSVRIIAKKDLILESQHPGGLEKIQYLEDTSRYKRTDQVDENVTIRPRFVTKPKSIDVMREGGHAHFECKLEPVTDSNLKVEWYKNGRPIIVGHRFRPIHDFGYVALDIIDVIEEDSGVYTCRATNMLGYDETSCSLKAKSTSQIITATQNEMGLEQIQYLEDRSRYQRHSEIEESTTQAPVFTSSLKHCEIKEGQRAHFECRLIPVSDNTMKVEWFHNGQPVKSGSRFTETNNFGFVALDILHCLPEDSGTYTCRAKNINGEAVTSSSLNVSSRKSIYMESQHESALSRLNQFEDRQYQKPSGPEETATQAPVFTQPMRDLRTTENQTAHFEARLIPVGDPRLKVEWLRNGVPISASNRVSTMHDFGYVALNMKYVYAEDSGTYTCRAKNDLGEAVTSATMTVQSKASLLTESQHEAALQKLQALEDSTKYHRTEEQEIVVNQKPNFTAKLNGPSQLVEGQSAHYECRIEPYPDPNLKVEWFHNGQPLQTGHRFRTTYDFGFAALDILTVYEEDTGEYTCRATNKLGQAVSSVNLKVQGRSGIIRDTQHKEALQKIQYLESDSRYKRIAEEEAAVTEKPQFGRPLKNVEHLPEGKQAHLEATLTPVNDPTMKVEWFRNGRPIPQGHRFKTVYDFGFVALDVLYAYAEDSGTYMCKARNAAGEAVTTCSVTVDSKAGLQLDTLDEQRLKKIKELEHYERPQPQEVEPDQQKPVFLTPLNSLENLKEGEHAHLECRVEPINDPHMKIEWFVNGKAIKTGHRFRTTHDFGYVALDILYTYSEDSGTYMCKATNKMGEAVNTCNIKAQSRHGILLETQHPEGLEKIRELEAQGHPQRLEIEEPLPTPPRFVTELRGTKEIAEGQTAHFEAQIEPLHDPNLRIEIYHNGKPLGSASRYHITFDFGYFALDIGHCLPGDAGEYSVKAINKLGSCVSSTSMQVVEKGSIISESQRPEGLEKIKQLEAGPQARPEVPEATTRQRPVFTQSLANIDGIAEGQNAHFECRLIPVGDPTLKVEWFRNEKLLEDSSRITKTHDFGFVSMDMTHVREDDEGVYMCRASNALGEAVTTASMKIKSKDAIQRETQHPEGMKKIQKLEDGKEPTRRDEPDQVFEKPIFTNLLTGPSELWEGQRAHFEARVVPVGDPTMRYLWYCNGVELKMGSRFHTTNDFGFVTLDIMATVPEDSGIYMCKAINAAGEAVSSTTLKVKPRSAISGEPLQPDAWQKIQLKEAEMNKVPEGFQEVTPQMPPVFTKHLSNAENLVEGSHVYLEALVEPKADPNLKIEWFKNGKSITTGARIRSTFDFGLVTLSVNGVRPDDSAIYTCKATNLLGEAVSTCTIKVEDRHWLLANSLRPEALPLIDALEGPKEAKGELPEPTFEGPVFISHLNNVVCTEGENSHFECRVEPAKDPTLNIEFFANGKLLPTGARFKGNHDFGFVTLDINSCYSDDSGIYTVKATNSKGQASTSGTLKCTGKSDIYLQTQHPQGQAGLEKVQEVDDAYASKLQRQDSKPEAQYPKPVWTTPLQAEFKLGEAQPLHLEATVEPKEDPNLKIEWYFNGKALEHGSRFKMTSEFGFVTLDLIEVYERDQGIYTCKAWNKAGEAFTTTTIYCSTKAGLIEKTQHPKGQEGLGKIQELEESLRKEDGKKDEAEEGQAPVFTSQIYSPMPPRFITQFQDISNLGEGEIAHFEASLTPVGDQSMRVEWFFNGKTIEASHRIKTVHVFGMVVLEILGTKIEDSGVYTCRATNKWGQAEISVNLECVDISKGQKPKFTTHIKGVTGLKDGDSVHFECTLIPVGDPSMRVEWFHNGRPIRHSTRIKQVSDFGFVLMDIAYTQSHDTGEYVCRAKNKYGEDFTRAHVECIGKGGVYYDTLQPDSLQKIRELEAQAGQQAAAPPAPVTEPPKFITQITDVTTLKEGQSAHFEARLTPVNDPNLTVEWFYNGKKLPHGHRYRTFHDFGIVILDILYCYAENTGEYECRATNLVGSDSTKAVLKCSSKANLILTSQLPEGMEGGLEKIQSLEESMIKTKDELVSETKGQAPVFTVPLSNIDSLREGENAHFEARLTPTDDPKLKVEWFWNNKPLRTGARFRTFCDFGFVILEISPVYPEDSGEYSCRASNEYGQAVTTSVMKVEGKRSIIIESQLPKGMEGTIDKIAELEGLGQLRPPVLPEDDLGKPPEFITQPADLTLVEYSLAHFECRLTPINDPSLRVEWFHNGKPLTAGSRFKTINDFGFVILEISGVDTRDAGLYTCKATNNHGEAVVSCKLQVRGRQGIIMEPQLPNTFSSGTESIQKLEEDLHKKDEVMETEEKPNPPKFIVDLRDFEAQEAGKAHFDCRVEPVGDPTLRIDWFFNGRPFATGSRVHMINDFGFVVLDMEYVYSRDAGEYICRATNRWGTATSKAKLTCKAKHDVVLESQLPQGRGMSGEKLRELERGKVTEPKPEVAAPTQPPKFVTQIASASVGESEPVRFECKVEPKQDETLKIEWYRNGKLLPLGHRYKTVFDMGFVSLDILYVYPEDSGDYVCRAYNAYGEDFTKASISCKKIPSIILQNQVPRGMKKSEALMQMEATIKKYTSEVHLTEEDLYEPEKKQPPRFVTQIKDQTELVEMEATKFECQLAPVGDPNMKVEWFYNGKPLHHKNRFTPIYDFGYVAMNFGWVYPEDSGEYLCRATNLYGMDETRAIIKTAGKPGIIYDSQLPKGMKSIEKIRELESSMYMTSEEKVEEEKEREAPVFVSKPEPCTVQEGDCARFCCRVTGFPRPRVVWLINDHTVVNGARCKLTYDGMWHLDIPKVRQYDTGTVTVVARNSSGEARVETQLSVTPRGDDYRGVLKNSPRPWYDSELVQYQQERQDTELEKVFEERSHMDHRGAEISSDLAKMKAQPKEDQPGWAQEVRLKKGEEYYNRLRELEGEQIVKENRIRESSHQFAIPGERVARKSVARGMAQSYETNLEKEPELMPWQKPRSLRATGRLTNEGEEVEAEETREQQNFLQQQVQQKPLQKVVRSTEATQSVEDEQKNFLQQQMRKPLQKVAKPTEGPEPSDQQANFLQQQMQQKPLQKVAKPTEGPEPSDQQANFLKQQMQQKPLQKVVKSDSTETSDRQQQNFLQQQTQQKTLQKVAQGRPPMDPSESTVHGKEIHQQTQKQVQKEVKGDQEITRKISTTETTEVEHKAHTQERVVQGQVKPAVPPVFTKKIQPCRAFENEPARFEVEFDGDPLPKIQWYREDFPITSSPDLQVHTFSTKSILVLRQVFLEDSGVFSVIAENRGGRAKCSANLVVEERKRTGRGGVIPPSFLTTVQSAAVKAGQLARFDAKIDGSKPLDVYWLKNGKKITSDIRYKTLEEDNTYTLLIIESAPEDSGNYECVAINQSGEARCEAELLVESPKKGATPGKSEPAGPQTAPSVVEKLTDQSRKEGQPVLFKCKISGKPAPTVQWFKGNQPIKPSKYFQMGRDGDVHTLRITEVFPEDEGVYKCEATNAVGKTSLSANLKVLEPDSTDVAPTLTQMRDVVVAEGASAQFRTQVSGKPVPTIQWYREGDLIPQSPDFQMIHEGKNVVLLVATTYEEDSGLFTCRATNSAGQVETSAKLIVKKKQEAGEPPKFVKPLKPKIAKKGTLTELECTVTGLPTPQVTWYRANEEIVPDRLHNVTFSPDTGKSVLTIVETTEIDEEIYAVRAVNKFGKAECRANLVLSDVPEDKAPEKLTPPKITKPLQAQVVPKEAPVTLEAEFTGSPKLTVKWFRNGKEIVETEEDEEIVEEETRTILRIRRTTKKKTGKYEVRVTNKVGEARTSCTLKTIDIEEMEEMEKVRAPRFIKPLKPTFVCEGEVVVMETLVESFPTCSFQWFIRDAPVTTRPDVRVSSEDNKSILVIEKITIEEAGEITCRAENVAGSVTSTASLQVGPESEVTELLSPTFLVKPQTAKVMDGESVLFTAKVVGQPTPQVKWYHNDKPIKEGKDKTIKQDEEGLCNLAIVEVFPEDSGVYTCVAKNIAGEAIAATTLSVEAYEYVPDSEMATVTEVESSTMLSVRSESEEDLLGDKEMTTEAPDEFRTAPTFITPLPQLVQATPGTILRMLVKAEGTPQPTIHWYKQGIELQPSEEFIIENLDDGTSILTIPEIYPDDAGEIICEAHNELGVTQTVAYVDLPEIMGTSLYKKPEWVIHMEEMQEKIKATQAEPTFVKEITDSSVKTEETVVFDALYAGNPQPVIIWYHNDKLLRASENVEISIKDNRTTVIIKKVKSENAGTYTCKASSNIGEVISTARINIIGFGEVQEEEVEPIQEEPVQVEKKKKKKRVKKVVTEEVERDSVDIEEVQPLESTVPFTETTETATAQRTFDIQESVAVSAVASCKKVSDEQDFPTDVPDVAGIVAPIQEPVTITETIPGDETVEMSVTQETTETASVTKSEQRSVSVTQTVTQSSVSELVTESRTETRATESTEILQTAQASRTTVSVSDIEETLEGLNVKEFGPWVAPLRELAKVDVLRKKGVSVEEVLTLYDTGELPALKTAPAQNALVSLVERVGHSSLISEMVTQEETLEGTLKGVLKAFLTMVDLRHATVQETIPLFRVRDFQTPHWETVSTMPVIAEETATETITETSQVEVQEMRTITQKKTKKVEQVVEEEASLHITKVVEEPGEVRIVETTEGSPLFSICSYVAETDDALSLVEGEKVYVIESNNSDWWFVKKHLTEEKGWVPAVYLRDEPSYTLYVQKKLHEKIDKLPIFEKPGPGAAVFAPKFVEKLQPKRVSDGGIVQFECKVEGNPRPQITWFRQTAIIKPSHDFQIFYDEDNVATLIISEIFPEDAGTFTCVAKNAAGFASSTTELVVESPLSDHGSDTAGLSRRSLSRESSLADILEGIPPTFSRKPKAKVVPPGSDVELEVRLVAIPEPEIQWFLKNKPVTPSANVSIVTQSDMHMYVNTMKISKVSRGQEGTYTVVAKNREGEASVDIILKIKTGEPEPPVVVDLVKDVTVTEGEGIVLTAQVAGVPTPKVVWLKDGRPVKLESSATGDTHTAVVRNSKPSDAGKYTLEATNSQGKASSTANVTVQDRRQQAPLFVERFEEVKVGEKGTIKLTAKVLANPIPSVTWFRNNKILLASPRITEMFDGEQILLEIENADSEQDAGDYKCVATNALGSATNGAKVTVDVAEVYFTKKLPSKYTVDENKNIIIECETSHTVSTTWFHDGKELSGMDNRELVQEGRTQRLVIKKASRKDKGTYTCKVKDKKTETNLIVHEVKPDFVRKLDDFEVKELQCAILEVEVSSDAADVVWTKDGMPLEPAPGKIEMEKRGPIHKLFIRSTSVHDEGEYTCQLGDEECSAEVTVIELPPEILTHLQDTSVPRGEKACLEVELTKGDALVRWFKDDVELQFSEHVQLSIDGKRQKLKIYQAEDSDGGIYSCKVGDQVSTARLTVEEPKVEFITRLPDVTMIPVGSDAEFTVELSVSDVDVKWLRKGKEIKPKADRYIITSSGATRKLVIKKVTLEDQTDITCMAINIKTTSKLKIEVIQTAPRITMDQKEYRVRKGEDVTFNLKFVGTPKLEHEWTVNGTVIKPSKRVIPSIDEESASLTIKKLEESDVGNYTLKLKNSVGEASAELTIIFIEVPGAPGTPEIVEVTDSSVTVTWKEPSSDGNSPITSYVLEHHDKEEFLSWNEITNITERTHKVTNLTKGHEVNFRVSAVNEVGKGKTSESSRYVKVEAPGSTQPPSFKEPLEDKACGIAKPVTLSCVVAGIPDPEVKWFKDGKALKSKTISYSNHVAKLTIESVVETSSGTYSCKASNSAGTAETSCKLAVQEAPTLKIDDDSLSQRLELRSQWKPVVEFSGYPAPQITWAKDGVPLVTDKRVTSYTDEKTTTVAIYSTDRKDSGTYTVTATNIAGSASLELKLKVIDKPTRPETIVIQEVEGEAVTIVWTPPADDGGVDISKYSLEKCDASKMIWTKVADIERDARTYVIQRLQCNAEYMFRIFAQNPVGTSDPAETNKVEITSKLGRPSTPTRPVEVSGMAETSCTITWGLPESDGGAPIVDYSVERKETDSDNWVKVGTTKDRHIIITELRKGKSYDFRIFARNRVGSSPPLVEENIIAGKTKTPPSPPNNIQVLNIASKSVTLKWEPPTSNGGSEVTDYVIEKQVNGSNTWTKVVTLDVNVLQFTIENLKEKSELYFRVFAENAVGLSLPTTTSLVSLKTHATVPSPPTAPLEMRSTGANSVMVSWGVPEKDGGAPIEGYKIAVRDMKKTMWMEVGRVGADVQKLTIKDLQENHEYLIRIYARNEVGMSDPLESDEPFRVQRPTGGEDIDVEDSRMDKDTPSLSFTTTTQSWMREAGMDPDIRSYSQSALLRRSEYFFRIWYYAKHLFK